MSEGPPIVKRAFGLSGDRHVKLRGDVGDSKNNQGQWE